MAKGREPRKIDFGSTTCPRCAKAYGKNYVVLLAEVAPVPSPDAKPAAT